MSGSRELFRGLADEMLGKLGRLASFTRHAPSVGSHHEEIVRETIRSMLSRRFCVRTGFSYQDETRVSRQGDILIVDESDPTPYFFRQGDLVVVHPRAVACVVEVKTRLTKARYKQAVECLASFNVAADGIEPKCYPAKFVFAFDSPRLEPKNLHPWYCDIDVADELMNYPDMVFSLKKGALQLKPAGNWGDFGHYFVMGEDRTRTKSQSLSIFLATIKKHVELKAGVASNPYGHADIAGLSWSRQFFRFGTGLVMNEHGQSN